MELHNDVLDVALEDADEEIFEDELEEEGPEEENE